MFNRISSDETRIYHNKPETMQQSKQWISSTNRTQKGQDGFVNQHSYAESFLDDCGKTHVDHLLRS